MFRGVMSACHNFSSSGVQTRRDWFNRAFVKSGVLSGQLFVKLAYVQLYRAACTYISSECFRFRWIGVNVKKIIT